MSGRLDMSLRPVALSQVIDKLRNHDSPFLFSGLRPCERGDPSTLRLRAQHCQESIKGQGVAQLRAPLCLPGKPRTLQHPLEKEKGRIRTPDPRSFILARKPLPSFGRTRACGVVAPPLVPLAQLIVPVLRRAGPHALSQTHAPRCPVAGTVGVEGVDDRRGISLGQERWDRRARPGGRDHGKAGLALAAPQEPETHGVYRGLDQIDPRGLQTRPRRNQPKVLRDPGAIPANLGL